MPRLLIIDDRDQTVEMVHRHLPQFETVTRCGRSIPCQVCEERDRGCTLKCAHDYAEAAEALSKYVVTDMYAKACQGMAAEEAVKWAEGELKKIYV